MTFLSRLTEVHSHSYSSPLSSASGGNRHQCPHSSLVWIRKVSGSRSGPQDTRIISLVLHVGAQAALRETLRKVANCARREISKSRHASNNLEVRSKPQ